MQGILSRFYDTHGETESNKKWVATFRCTPMGLKSALELACPYRITYTIYLNLSCEINHWRCGVADFGARTIRPKEHREVGRFFPINVYLQNSSSKANPLRGIVVRFTCVLQPVSMELP